MKKGGQSWEPKLRLAFPVGNVSSTDYLPGLVLIGCLKKISPLHLHWWLPFSKQGNLYTLDEVDELYKVRGGETYTQKTITWVVDGMAVPKMVVVRYHKEHIRRKQIPQTNTNLSFFWCFCAWYIMVQYMMKLWWISTCDVFPQELVTALPYFNASGSDGTSA